ncbi:nuclear pore glycoprotein p62 [Drosophila willistoni]|uniref:GK21694 n=1 Tax=Drosophila willistoni TaxID=7260 RepID=B4MPF9_DROWI|nr:nuclear pore glycoprotein p62 [Drosophila willistoni]
MSFQLPTTTTAPAAAPAFSFGLNTSAATAAVPAAKPTFSFAAPAATGVPTLGANLGGGDADAAKVAAQAAPPPFGGFGLGATTTPALGTVTPVATTSAAAPAATQLFGGFKAPAAAAPAAVIAPVVAATTTAAPALAPLVSAPAPVAVASTLPAVGTTALNAAAVPATTGGFANLTTETKTTDSSAVSTTTQMSYNQLEDHINKWTLEFEEQEKIFTEQATQINAWDKLLISNNLKIVELNDAVRKVKNDQQVLDQELEFIATQHKELEESLGPLEKEFNSLNRDDVERKQTYLMVENLDTQLKQMSEDLKEIIDNLNEANKGQDNTDPIIQIGKILNAHMSSLQWIESQSTNICKKLDDIGKIQDSQKREIFRPPF